MEKQVILFVDDEKKVLSSLKRLFRGEPYRVLTANSGSEALALIEAGEKPAVVVSDQRMPKMNGAKLLQRISDALPDTVRILLTGYSDIEAAMDAVNKGGIYRYMQKPWEDEDLLLVIRGAVQHYQLTGENRRLTRQLKKKNRELKRFNATLEQQVEQRTEALRKTYEKNLALTEVLKVKVRELEGRDRIQQHLLAVHPLEETLQTVAEVVAEVVEGDGVHIHLLNKESGQLEEGVSIGANDRGRQRDKFQQRIFAKVIEEGEAVRLKKKKVRLEGETRNLVPFAAVPILRGSECLGIIEVEKEQGLKASEVGSVLSFALQAAVAICDSQLRDDIPELQGGLDEVLEQISDLA